MLRFAWVWTSLRLTLFKAKRRGLPRPKLSLRLVAAMSLAGVRGAITLAGVLTLPLTLPGGAPFPTRDLAILLAAGVILVSLVIASFGLPRVLRGLHLPPEQHDAEVDAARIAASQAAIRAVEIKQQEMAEGRPDADLYTEISAEIMEGYRQRIEGARQTPEAAIQTNAINAIERRLRLAGLGAERDEIFRRARSRELQDEQVRKLVREIDLIEARYSG